MAWKRLISWTAFLAILAAIGCGIHLLLPPAPRWMLDGPFEILGITADSQQFWTVQRAFEVDGPMGRRGPLQLRNMNNGEVAAEYLTSATTIASCSVSPSGRFVAGFDAALNCLHIVDREGRRDHKTKLPQTVQERSAAWKLLHGELPAPTFVLSFSPDETHLVYSENIVHIAVFACYSLVVETATGEIKCQFHEFDSFQAFVGDGAHVLFFNSYSGKQILWNIVENRNETRRLGAYGRACYGPVDRARDISSNGRHFLTHSEGEVAICDSINWKLRTIPDWNDLWFSPSGRLLIDDVHIDDDGKSVVGHRTIIFDAQSGERVGGYAFDGTADTHRRTFSRDESMCLLISNSPTGEPLLEARRLPDGTRLWRKPAELLHAAWRHEFTANNSVLFALDDTIEIWDGETGNRTSTVWKPNHLGKFKWVYQPELSHDRRFVHCIGLKTSSAGWWDEWASKRLPWLFPTGIVLVADATSGRNLLHLPLRSFQPYDVVTRLSEDGQFLVLSWAESETGAWRHSAYDIPARPRWAWIIGVPAGVYGTVLSLRELRRRSKSKKQQPSAAATSS